MKRVLLTNQKVMLIDDCNSYHEVNVLLSADNEQEATASIPELGRIQVVREKQEEYPEISIWQIKDRFIFTEEENVLFIARVDMPHVKLTCNKTESAAIKQSQEQFNFFEESRYVYKYQEWFLVIDKTDIETWFYGDTKPIGFKLEVIR